MPIRLFVKIDNRATTAFITLGTSHGDIEDPDAFVSDANNFHIHPDWNSITFFGDVALVKLPTPISFSGNLPFFPFTLRKSNYCVKSTDKIRPVCLPTSQESKHVDDDVIVSGWGRVSDSKYCLSASTLTIKRTLNT